MSLQQASAPEVLVELVRGDGPLARQITDQLRAAITDGRLAASSPLPSSRALASDLGVARATVTEAYEQLAAEGWVVAEPRRAPRVAATPSLVAARAVTPPPRPASPAPPPGAPPPGPLPERLRFDLRPGRPDLSAFPRREWLRAARRVLGQIPDADLCYGEIQGDLVLREALAAYLGRVRGVRTTPAAVNVCAGVAQGLMIASGALLERGIDAIAVESPGHCDIRADFVHGGLTVVPVPVDDEGLRADLIPDGVRAVSVTPAHQFPTGAVLSPARRDVLLRHVRERDGLVLEDDYDAEFRYGRRPVGALQGLDPDHVVALGSLSKTLAPGLRLGWAVVPPAWQAAFDLARARQDRGLSRLEQAIVAELVTSGDYDRHLRARRRSYARRRDTLLEALAATLPEATVSGAAAGLHLLVTIPDADELALLTALAERGVAAEGLDRHRATPPGSHDLLRGTPSDSHEPFRGTPSDSHEPFRGTPSDSHEPFRGTLSGSHEVFRGTVSGCQKVFRATLVMGYGAVPEPSIPAAVGALADAVSAVRRRSRRTGSASRG